MSVSSLAGFTDAVPSGDLHIRPASADAAVGASGHTLTDAAADEQKADRLTSSLDLGEVT